MYSSSSFFLFLSLSGAISAVRIHKNANICSFVCLRGSKGNYDNPKKGAKFTWFPSAVCERKTSAAVFISCYYLYFEKIKNHFLSKNNFFISFLKLFSKVFILCWAPYIVFDLLQVYGHIPKSKTMIAVATFIQSLAPLNSAANPLIYCLFSTHLCRNLR